MVSESIPTGRHIRILMAARDFNQTALAQATGISPAIISLICNDKARPTESQVRAIKQALAWPLENQAQLVFSILADSGDIVHFQEEGGNGP